MAKFSSQHVHDRPAWLSDPKLQEIDLGKKSVWLDFNGVINFAPSKEIDFVETVTNRLFACCDGNICWLSTWAFENVEKSLPANFPCVEDLLTNKGDFFDGRAVRQIEKALQWPRLPVSCDISCVFSAFGKVVFLLCAIDKGIITKPICWIDDDPWVLEKDTIDFVLERLPGSLCILVDNKKGLTLENVECIEKWFRL